MLDDELHLNHGSIFRELAGQPISAIFDQFVSVLFLGLYELALCLFLIGIATFSWRSGWVASRSRCTFEFVNSFGVEGIGDTLTIAFTDSPIGLALLLHSNYNTRKGKDILDCLHFHKS